VESRDSARRAFGISKYTIHVAPNGRAGLSIRRADFIEFAGPDAFVIRIQFSQHFFGEIRHMIGRSRARPSGRAIFLEIFGEFVAEILT